MTKRWVGAAVITLAATFCGSASAVKSWEDYSVRACALISAEQVATVLGVKSVTPGLGYIASLSGTWICGFYLEGQKIPKDQYRMPEDMPPPLEVTLFDDEFITARRESEPSDANLTIPDYYGMMKSDDDEKEPIEAIGDDGFFRRLPSEYCKDADGRHGYDGNDSLTFLKGSVIVSISAPCGPTPLEKEKFVAIAKIIADGMN